MSTEDWQALKELKSDERIVIKEVDKGGANVIMDSVYYEQMIYKQLKDKNIKKWIHPVTIKQWEQTTYSLESIKTLF